MKTVFLLSALACAALAAAPRSHNYRHVSAEDDALEMAEAEQPHFELREGKEQPHEEHFVQSKESGIEQKFEESTHMAKAAFDNLEKDLDNLKEPEQSAEVKIAKQAVEDARKTFRELQAKRMALIASSIADDAVTVPTSELKESKTERMSQWKGQNHPVLRNEEGSAAPKGHKEIEMEEAASNNKESFRVTDPLNNMVNNNFHMNPEQGQISKSNKGFTSSIELKSAEDVEKVEQPTKNLKIENMSVKNTLNRNTMSLTHDAADTQHFPNSNMEKKVNLNEHLRASSQVLEVPQPKQKNIKLQFFDEPSPMLPVDNTNEKNRYSSMKSAEHIDSIWSSTQNNEQVIGKSAEFEETGDSAQHGNQFVATHKKASQADLPWRPPGSKIHMRNQESELMSKNMHWENLPQSEMRSAYGAAYGIGGGGDAGFISGAGAGAGAIGIFPNAQVSNCAIPLLLSCSPSVVSGSLGKSYASSYGSSAGAYGGSVGAYRSDDKVHQPSKRDVRNLNRIELTKTKRTTPKKYPEYRVVPSKY